MLLCIWQMKHVTSPLEVTSFSSWKIAIAWLYSEVLLGLKPIDRTMKSWARFLSASRRYLNDLRLAGSIFVTEYRLEKSSELKVKFDGTVELPKVGLRSRNSYFKLCGTPLASTSNIAIPGLLLLFVVIEGATSKLWKSYLVEVSSKLSTFWLEW